MMCRPLSQTLHQQEKHYTKDYSGIGIGSEFCRKCSAQLRNRLTAGTFRANIAAAVSGGMTEWRSVCGYERMGRKRKTGDWRVLETWEHMDFTTVSANILICEPTQAHMHSYSLIGAHTLTCILQTHTFLAHTLLLSPSARDIHPPPKNGPGSHWHSIHLYRSFLWQWLWPR